MRAAPLLALAALVLAGPCSAETLEAQVVDALTGRPIEGAVVHGRWTPPSGPPSEMEVETDAQGRFTLDRPPGPLREEGELVVAYKFGYVVWINSLVVNVQGPRRAGEPPPTSQRRQDPRVPAQITLTRFPADGHRPWHLQMLYLVVNADGHKDRRPKLLNAIKPEEELCRKLADCD